LKLNRKLCILHIHTPFVIKLKTKMPKTKNPKHHRRKKQNKKETEIDTNKINKNIIINIIIVYSKQIGFKCNKNMSRNKKQKYTAKQIEAVNK